EPVRLSEDLQQSRPSVRACPGHCVIRQTTVSRAEPQKWRPILRHAKPSRAENNLTKHPLFHPQYRAIAASISLAPSKAIRHDKKGEGGESAEAKSDKMVYKRSSKVIDIDTNPPPPEAPPSHETPPPRPPSGGKKRR